MKFFASELSSSTSWDDFVHRVRARSCLDKNVRELPHPAAALLEELRTRGAPFVRNQSNWSADQKDTYAYSQGYPSTARYLGFLENELVDMIKKNYFIVLPYAAVRNYDDLKLSHAGVIPQPDRRPRTIIDYRASGVNGQTVPLAPPDAMQFGHALNRLLHAIFTADPAHGPVYALKHDVSDGYYRIRLQPAASLALAMVLPTTPGEEPLVAIPLVLPMGWTESPPYFCVATETITDLANACAGSAWAPSRHPLEGIAATEPSPPEDGRPHHTLAGLGPEEEATPHEQSSESGPLAYFDVFIDDTIGVAQGDRSRLERVRRQFLYCHDTVFRPNDASDQDRRPAAYEPMPDTDPAWSRRPPSSESKFKKGDSAWSTYKTILGWIVDTLGGTIELTDRRRHRLLEILDTARHRQRISVRSCQKLLGELRSMLLAISGGAGLFSQLQQALKSSKSNRVRLSQAARDHLNDLYQLALDVANRPTRLAELFPVDPGHILGACDAAKSGMGGIFFDEQGQPYAWRQDFPLSVQSRLISDDNPAGSITNSDLELAASIVHEGTVATAVPVVERTVRTGSDNTPTVAWRNKGSASTKGPAAYLLRLASLQQRALRHVPRVHYIAGPVNVLADATSRRFDLSDTALLALLNELAPQTQPWRLLHPPPELLSKTISALLQQRPDNTLDPIAPRLRTPSGTNAGSLSSPSSGWTTTPCSAASTTKSPSFGSSLNASGMDAEAAVVTRSQLTTWLTRYSRLPRRSRIWGPGTLAATL